MRDYCSALENFQGLAAEPMIPVLRYRKMFCFEEMLAL
jgi:hypothetical protein